MPAWKAALLALRGKGIKQEENMYFIMFLGALSSANGARTSDFCKGEPPESPELRPTVTEGHYRTKGIMQNGVSFCIIPFLLLYGFG